MISRLFDWYVLLLVFCLLVVIPRPAGASGTPSMAIPETAFDFGEVDEGSIVSHIFVVKNTGDASLQISRVNPG